MTHTLKILESYAEAVLEGRKTFEVRLNDRGYNAGDKVRFRVIDDHCFDIYNNPLNKKLFDITYVHSGLGMQDGYVVFGIKESSDADSN